MNRYKSWVYGEAKQLKNAKVHSRLSGPEVISNSRLEFISLLWIVPTWLGSRSSTDISNHRVRIAYPSILYIKTQVAVEQHEERIDHIPGTLPIV